MSRYIHQVETQICGQYRRYEVGVEGVKSIDKYYEREINEVLYSVEYENGMKIDITGPQMIVVWKPIK